jgi:hypothetical protein
MARCVIEPCGLGEPAGSIVAPENPPFERRVDTDRRQPAGDAPQIGELDLRTRRRRSVAKPL